MAVASLWPVSLGGLGAPVLLHTLLDSAKEGDSEIFALHWGVSFISDQLPLAGDFIHEASSEDKNRCPLAVFPHHLTADNFIAG